MHHEITMERPILDTHRAWYRAICLCGWRSTPTYVRTTQIVRANAHLAGVWNASLFSALEAAADAGTTLNVAEWRAANPKRTLV